MDLSNASKKSLTSASKASLHGVVSFYLSAGIPNGSIVCFCFIVRICSAEW